MKNIFEKVLQVAKQQETGFTISIVDFTSQKKGWAVAFKETQNSFGEEGLKKVIDFAIKNSTFVGGWLDNESKNFYFDAIKIVEDEEEATKLGIENEQLAIFNLETETLKPLI